MGKEEKPRLNHTAIAYPMDQVTLGDMRRQEPILFNRIIDFSDGNDALTVHAIEQRVAEKAFAKRLGLPDPYPTYFFNRYDMIAALNDGYKPYGISTGIHQTRQLVRDIEAAAILQADQFKGRSK